MAKLTKTEQQQYDICLGQCSMCMQKLDCELRIKVKEIKTVDIIASGYEWICPECGADHDEIEWMTIVTCSNCNTEFQTNPPEHAMGK